MEQSQYTTYLNILREELYPALGCTEPIAIALAAANARKLLGTRPERLALSCSVNMFKNAKCVTVPNSGGKKGMDVAAALGALGGNPEGGLEVLQPVTEAVREQAQEFLAAGRCTCRIAGDVDNLYIAVLAQAGGHTAEVTIAHSHTSIVKQVKDGRVLSEEDGPDGEGKTGGADRSALCVKDILAFAEAVRLEDIEPLLSLQISRNRAISEEGLKTGYGAQVSRALSREGGADLRARAKALAAAGSDARMSGCGMPVVINSGSGNQGLTVTMPVLVYAEHLHAGKEKLCRALVISNLMSIHQKRFLGKLSAFCGAVTAASGAGAAITYLYGGSYDQICGTVINTLASIGGMVCDGAKASCAAKIAAALDAAITGMEMSLNGKVFQDGDGVVRGDVEETIKAVGYLGRVGMRETDREILNLMTGEAVL